jgi:hypothetical protein
MEAGPNITASDVAAYLKCPTNAHLTAHREKPTGCVFVEARKRIRSL